MPAVNSSGCPIAVDDCLEMKPFVLINMNLPIQWRNRTQSLRSCDLGSALSVTAVCFDRQHSPQEVSRIGFKISTIQLLALQVWTRSKSKYVTHQVLSCPFLCLIQQGDEWESGLQFLPATDSRRLEKKPGRTKKLWMGLGLLLAAACVALLTGLLVWHFHRELPSLKLYLNTSIVVSAQTSDSDSHSLLWD